MSTKGLFMAAALFLGLVATSCTEEQSELNLNTIEGTATVTGQIYYNSGYNSSSGVSDYYSVLGYQTVYVDVKLSNYDSNASGVERYTTTTDALGNYSMTIPCSVSMVSMSVTIKVPSFTAAYYVVSSSYPISAVYEGGSAGTSVTLYPGDTVVKNININGPID